MSYSVLHFSDYLSQLALTIFVRTWNISSDFCDQLKIVNFNCYYLPRCEDCRVGQLACVILTWHTNWNEARQILVLPVENSKTKIVRRKMTTIWPNNATEGRVRSLHCRWACRLKAICILVKNRYHYLEKRQVILKNHRILVTQQQSGWGRISGNERQMKNRMAGGSEK